jgi:hypothetical protein
MQTSAPDAVLGTLVDVDVETLASLLQIFLQTAVLGFKWSKLKAFLIAFSFIIFFCNKNMSLGKSTEKKESRILEFNVGYFLYNGSIGYFFIFFIFFVIMTAKNWWFGDLEVWHISFFVQRCEL